MTVTSASIGIEAWEQLAADRARRPDQAGRSRLRPGARRLQRHDRQASRGHRALPRRRRRHHLRAVRPRRTASRSRSAAAATTPPASACGTTPWSSTCRCCAAPRSAREDHTVRADAGCTWGDVDHATVAFGMATPSGFIASTGVAGLTLGGGTGYLTRRFGLTVDNLLSADVVLADGTFVTASETRTPTCSGRCAAAAGTSAWSRRSRSAATTSARPARSSAARCCTTSPTPPR